MTTAQELMLDREIQRIYAKAAVQELTSAADGLEKLAEKRTAVDPSSYGLKCAAGLLRKRAAALRKECPP